MNFLEARIVKEGVVKPGGVLKVDSFLNHQLDMALLSEIGKAFHSRFSGERITRVLTIESSGIAIAYPVAAEFGVPLVVAKKSRSVNLDGEVYVAEVASFDGKTVNQVVVSKKFLSPDDRVLIVDDILANGYTLQGLISIVDSADAEVAGLGIAIEKGFQEGGYRMRNLGYRLESIAIVEDMDPETGSITFRKQ